MQYLGYTKWKIAYMKVLFFKIGGKYSINRVKYLDLSLEAQEKENKITIRHQIRTTCSISP